MYSILEFCEQLGFNTSNGLYITKENTWQKDLSLPNRVRRIIENTLQPDAFFCVGDKPLILFFISPNDVSTLHKKIWNFNESPVSIIIFPDKINILNSFKYNNDLKLLCGFGDNTSLNDFSYFELVTGNTWENYKDHLSYTNRVDYKLLENIESAQKIFVDKFSLKKQMANALLGKVIFVRYLIDRKVKLKFRGISKEWTNNDFCSLLDNPQDVQEFFDYLQDPILGFNGDMFPISAKDFADIPIGAFQVLKALLGGTEIASGQLSLFDLYDFSILPIEFISNVYEKFIGQNNQASNGAYYTPTFLVDYILRETLEVKLRHASVVYDCKILDPACGSGIFLVESYRKIVEKYLATSKKQLNQKQLKKVLKQLASNNIFGIDKDQDAVYVAVFSLYLTMLDYLEPAEIANFRFPKLLGCNFFSSDFFDQAAPFNELFRTIDFDFIVGNPPWKSGMTQEAISYIEGRRKREKELSLEYPIGINNKELAECFVLRVSDFSSPETQIALVVRSCILYNSGADNNKGSAFRKYWLQEFHINKVMELASVRKEVFERSNDPAIAPAAILFYKYAARQSTDKNLVEYISLKPSRFFSLFKIFTLNRSDYKLVQQDRLKKYDWLWKTLIYGSHLDFLFIKRLKEEYPSIAQIISNDETFAVGTGLHYGKGKKYDSKHLINQEFIDADGIESFFINTQKISPFDKTSVGRIRDQQLFRSPMLLIRSGLNTRNLTMRGAISTRDLLFKNSVSSIKLKDPQAIEVLYDLLSVMSSDLAAYYAIHTFSSVGVEREQAKDYEKFCIPYVEIASMDIAKKIEILKSNQHKQLLHSPQDKDKLEKYILKLNDRIFEHLDLTDIERAIIDYSLQVTRSFITHGGEERYITTGLEYGEPYLEDYATIFWEYFKDVFDRLHKHFCIEIFYSKQIIGMIFRIIPTIPDKPIIWRDKQDNLSELLPFFIKLGVEKITDQLFFQKDIRGFEEEFFYIFKANEKRLWHKAIGYSDVEDFIDAILRSEENKL